MAERKTDLPVPRREHAIQLLQFYKSDSVRRELLKVPVCGAVAGFLIDRSNLGAREGTVKEHAACVVVDGKCSTLHGEEGIDLVERLVRILDGEERWDCCFPFCHSGLKTDGTVALVGMNAQKLRKTLQSHDMKRYSEGIPCLFARRHSTSAQIANG